MIFKNSCLSTFVLAATRNMYSYICYLGIAWSALKSVVPRERSSQNITKIDLKATLILDPPELADIKLLPLPLRSFTDIFFTELNIGITAQKMKMLAP